MTADEAVEVMARAIRRARFPWEKWEFLPPASKNAAMDEARAAIRELREAGGLVLREVPELRECHPAGEPGFDADKNQRRIGYNVALADVRALAVEVGP